MFPPSILDETPAWSETHGTLKLFVTHSYNQSLSLSHPFMSGVSVYQGLVGSIELLQDLVHNGVGEIGNHRQLYFSKEEKGRKRSLKVRGNQHHAY